MTDTSDLTESLVRMADWYKGQAHYYMDRAAKAERERDEARELAQQMSESNQVILADLRHYREEWKKLKEGAA
jgi:hypothetical protein